MIHAGSMPTRDKRTNYATHGYQLHHNRIWLLLQQVHHPGFTLGAQAVGHFGCRLQINYQWPARRNKMQTRSIATATWASRTHANLGKVSTTSSKAGSKNSANTRWLLVLLRLHADEVRISIKNKYAHSRRKFQFSQPLKREQHRHIKISINPTLMKSRWTTMVACILQKLTLCTARIMERGCGDTSQ